MNRNAGVDVVKAFTSREENRPSTWPLDVMNWMDQALEKATNELGDISRSDRTQR
jgi:hypothetical protein